MKSLLRSGGRMLLALVFLTGVAQPASADWLLTPYLGVVFGGAANTLDLEDLDEQFDERLTYGGSLAWMGAGIVGVEFDFNFSPNFFQITEGGVDTDVFEVDSSITTLMGNVIVGVPIGGQSGLGFRPYFAGGAGLMRANLSAVDLFDDLSTNELGINVGGGFHLFFTDTFGLRGDVRYFRGLEQDEDEDDDDDDLLDPELRLEDFDYWRASFGVTFRFGR